MSSPEDSNPEASVDEKKTNDSAAGTTSGSGPPVVDAEHGLSAAFPFFIVGVGASAGGLEALESFFQSCSTNSPTCYVVVQHLSPDFRSMMPELLRRRTSLEVCEIQSGMIPRPGVLYLLGPTNALTITAEGFHLETRTPGGIFLPINIFLESLALTQGDQCAAVILSGTGTDGTHGARQIREAGGLVAVQDPLTAKFDGMPNSVLAQGLQDLIASPRQLMERLDEYVEHPLLPLPGNTNATPSGGVDKPDAVLRAIIQLLKPVARLDFSAYKEGMILRRLRRRASLLGTVTLEQYAVRLRSDSEELEQIARDLLIGVTQFFRDPDAWSYLESEVIPKLVESIPDRGTLRVWVVACSTGEEAYTLAMLLEEHMQRVQRGLTLRLFATDVRRDTLRFARSGAYPLIAGEAIPPSLREKYFEVQGDYIVARRSLRDMITFAPHDVLQDPPFTQLGMVTCRNMLIYLRTSAQQRAFARFRIALKQGGFLFLGASETVGDAKANFSSVNSQANVFVADGTRDVRPQQLGVSLRDEAVHEAPENRRSPAAIRTAEALLEAAVEHYAPPGVAVDEQLNVLQVFGHVSDYIRVPSGRATSGLLRMVAPSLGVLINSAAKRALKEGGEVVVPAVRVPVARGERVLTLKVRRITECQPSLPGCLLIFFQAETEHRGTVEVASGVLEGATQLRLRELEDELIVARDGLQSAVQDQEATNEELQATNEELTASNEELQSTNEELQSVNEELYTVNSEYQQKICELEELNSDLENLLRVIDAGVLFLDDSLAIRRFNQSCTRMVPIRQEDVGRPLQEIAIQADFSDMAAAAQTVLETGIPQSRTVRAEDGAWWDVGLRLFGSDRSARDGVIVTMKEVSELKRAISELVRTAQAHELAETLNGMGHAVIDPAARTVAYSPGARRLLGLKGPHRLQSIESALNQFNGAERSTLEGFLNAAQQQHGMSFTAIRTLPRADGSSHRVRMSVQVGDHRTSDLRLIYAFFQPVAPGEADSGRSLSRGLSSDPEALPAAHSAKSQ